ncbi:hypothetical protein BDV59DRAFT_205433 [Aspergillus ambiguus]|uniref:J domain-containing protein n=1 Tax=Aspergillus ambiguus TaxID=176160 RepID=UPI003CCE3FBA
MQSIAQNPSDNGDGVTQEPGANASPGLSPAVSAGSGPQVSDVMEQTLCHILRGSPRDYERILTVQKTASDSDKKRAYRQKILLVHPDRYPPEMRERAHVATQWLNEAIVALRGPGTTLPKVKLTLPSTSDVGEEWHPSAFGEESETDDTDDEEASRPVPYASEPIKRRKAPKEIWEIYRNATPAVRALLQNADNSLAWDKIESARREIAAYYNLHEEIESWDRFDIIGNLLRATSQEACTLRKKLANDKTDVIARMAYANLMDRHRMSVDIFGWPPEWKLQDFDENDVCAKFYLPAQPYIEALKENPDDQVAITKLKEINSQIEKYAEDNMLEGEGLTIPDYALLDYYKKIDLVRDRLAQDETDSDAATQALDLDAGIRQVIGKQFPLAWVVQGSSTAQSGQPSTRGSTRSTAGTGSSTQPSIPPDGASTGSKGTVPASGMGHQPCTRTGEPILGHRRWKVGSQGEAWLFAVLNDENSRVGELRSGTLIGCDAKEAYLGSKKGLEVTNIGPGQRGFWEKTEYFFLRPRKNEIWEIWALCKTPTERLLVTLTSYRHLRRGVDADYDIALFCTKYGRPIPPNIAKKVSLGHLRGITNPPARSTEPSSTGDDGCRDPLRLPGPGDPQAWRSQETQAEEILRRARSQANSGRTRVERAQIEDLAEKLAQLQTELDTLKRERARPCEP